LGDGRGSVGAAGPDRGRAVSADLAALEWMRGMIRTAMPHVACEVAMAETDLGDLPIVILQAVSDRPVSVTGLVEVRREVEVRVDVYDRTWRPAGEIIEAVRDLLCRPLVGGVQPVSGWRVLSCEHRSGLTVPWSQAGSGMARLQKSFRVRLRPED
ncbi:MAG: hypothetical protein MH204_08090, partial [Fimbriimonadaceae bacterium]|nr:hypothetical protein [Fimbriimonadaceae bacterium]